MKKPQPRQTHHHHRRCRFPRLASLRAAVGRGNDAICLDNFFTGTKDNIAHLLDNPYFELRCHNVTVPLNVEADEIYNLACPVSPIHYQFNPVQATKYQCAWCEQLAGTVQAGEGEDIPGLHQRSVRRPTDLLATGELLDACQS